MVWAFHMLGLQCYGLAMSCFHHGLACHGLAKSCTVQWLAGPWTGLAIGWAFYGLADPGLDWQWTLLAMVSQSSSLAMGRACRCWK